jgi:hypothetical protein
MSKKTHSISFLVDEYTGADYDSNLVPFEGFYNRSTEDQTSILDSIIKCIELHKSITND